MLIIQNLSYRHPDRELLFDNITFSLPKGGKVALIGDNGSGKSTLLRIVAGILKPASGEVKCAEQPYYVPQHFGQYDSLTVADALGIDQKIKALNAIISGDLSFDNYTILDEDWSIEERAATSLTFWGLNKLDLSVQMDSLSGGEKTKVFIAGIALHNPNLILMDEPSNHLDRNAREKLYRLIETSPATILLVSHDRTLLNKLNTIYELSPGGITAYGGNYDFYKARKAEAVEALRQDLDDKEKSLRAARRTARETVERKQRQDTRGATKARTEGIPRIMMKTMKNRAESATSKLRGEHSEKIEKISGELHDLRRKLPADHRIKVDVENSNLHQGKILIEAREINYTYGEQNLWESPLSFRVLSGERLALRGNNGWGKTTLIRMILGNLPPTEGVLERPFIKTLYIDQEYSLLDNTLLVYEQAERFNIRNLPEHFIKTLLHRHLFPLDTWEKPVGSLSGGEKMRLIFCCLTVQEDAPDLFILDEPTNNLDIRSLEIITEALKAYRGTLLVVSHDDYFLHEIGITGHLLESERSLF